MQPQPTHHFEFGITDSRFSTFRGGLRNISISATDHKRWTYILKKADEGFNENKRIYYDPKQKLFHLYTSEEAPKGWIKLNITEIVLISSVFLGRGGGKNVDSSSLKILSDFYQKMKVKASDSFFSRVVNLFWRSLGPSTTKHFMEKQIAEIEERKKALESPISSDQLKPNISNNVGDKNSSAEIAKQQPIEKQKTTEADFAEKEKQLNIHLEKLKNLCTSNSPEKPNLDFTKIRNFDDFKTQFSKWIDEASYRREALSYKLMSAQLDNDKTLYYSGYLEHWANLRVDKRDFQKSLKAGLIIQDILKEMKALNQLFKEYPDMQQFS